MYTTKYCISLQVKFWLHKKSDYTGCILTKNMFQGLQYTNHVVSHFASRASAMDPDNIGAAALVPPKP